MEKFTSFAEAIKSNNILVVKEMLDENPTLIHSVTPEGISVIMLAAYHRYTKLLEILVMRKRRLDIFEASATGVLREVERNIEKNKSLVIAESSDGYSPLALACWFGHYEVARFLLSKEAQMNFHVKNDTKATPLHLAVSAGFGDVVNLLLKSGAETNAKQQNDMTPLHIAATNGHQKMAQLLLDNGADRMAKTTDGKTPADLAKAKGFNDLAKMLA